MAETDRQITTFCRQPVWFQMALPAGQAVGCMCAAGVAAGSAWTREKQRGPGWSWDMHGWGPGSAAQRADPVASLGVLPTALPTCSWRPAVTEGLPAVPQRRGGGGTQWDSGGLPEPKPRCRRAAAAPESCDWTGRWGRQAGEVNAMRHKTPPVTHEYPARGHWPPEPQLFNHSICSEYGSTQPPGTVSQLLS